MEGQAPLSLARELLGVPLSLQAEAWEPSSSLSWKLESLADPAAPPGSLCLAEKHWDGE